LLLPLFSAVVRLDPVRCLQIPPRAAGIHHGRSTRETVRADLFGASAAPTAGAGTDRAGGQMAPGGAIGIRSGIMATVLLVL
jgi:hypothetical protein